ncbi:hypothetical protein M404DRAFT_993889, partial [Pisolithus tinctorius Marx 270]
MQYDCRQSLGTASISLAQRISTQFIANILLRWKHDRYIWWLGGMNFLHAGLHFG